jgi:hypothetical protein
MGASATGVKRQNLPSDWIIDWRRFFDFDGIFKFPYEEGRNRAKKIDTSFNFNLGSIAGYPNVIDERYKPITIRNLVRGYFLGLPCGQKVAEHIKAKKRLPDASFLDVPYADVLRDGGFHQRTPLWYYILKEAEQFNGGNRLGDVGRYIIARTFAGILNNSDISILKDKDWVPYLRKDKPGHFEMVDLLEVADVVDPVGQRDCKSTGKQYPCD